MNYKSFIFLICFICLTIACDDKPITIIESSEELKLYDYYIDEFGNEGVVAYLKDGIYSQFAIVISADETEAIWGPGGFVLFDADSTMIANHINRPRFSLMMSRLVSEYGASRFDAFKWCLDKNHGRQLDSESWMLPSYHEYNAIFKKIRLEALNEALTEIGGEPLKHEAYWTCTEDHYGILDTDAGEYDPVNWVINLIPSEEDGIRYSFYTRKYIFWNKSQTYKVRAIKYIWLVQDNDSLL